MIIDCDSCAVRDLACGDCVVGVLLRQDPRRTLEVDDDERRALDALADSGLVPRLRLVAVHDPARGRSGAGPGRREAG